MLLTSRSAPTSRCASVQVDLYPHQRLGITIRSARPEGGLVIRPCRGHRPRPDRQCSPAELYDRPATPYVASFVGTSNLVPAIVVASDADGMVAEAGGHRLRARSGARRFAPGAHVLIAIRPEKVVTVPAGGAVPDAFNRIEARVIEHLFHGHGLRTEFDIGCVEPFMVDIQLPAALAEVGLAAPGASVTLAVDPANLTVFPADRQP
jgi:ABC-type Fe3+/spermidine/putrescine transport system ATPase subunit